MLQSQNNKERLIICYFSGHHQADVRLQPLRHPDCDLEASELQHQHRRQEAPRPPGHGQADGRAEQGHQVLVQA